MPFPFTGALLDTSGANESPLSNGGKFSGSLVPGASAFQLLSHEVVGLGTGQNDAVYVNSTFGPDCEVWMTMNTASSHISRVVARWTNTGLSTFTGYDFEMSGFTGSVGYILRVFVNGVQVAAPASGSQELSNGDSFGISCIGTSISLWYKVAVGIWTQLGSTITDSNVSGAGNVGFSADTTAVTIGAFGGGSLAATYNLSLDGGTYITTGADLSTVYTGPRLALRHTV